jgi:hypothetical protein
VLINYFFYFILFFTDTNYGDNITTEPETQAANVQTGNVNHSPCDKIKLIEFL